MMGAAGCVLYVADEIRVDVSILLDAKECHIKVVVVECRSSQEKVRFFLGQSYWGLAAGRGYCPHA